MNRRWRTVRNGNARLAGAGRSFVGPCRAWFAKLDTLRLRLLGNDLVRPRRFIGSAGGASFRGRIEPGKLAVVWTGVRIGDRGFHSRVDGVRRNGSLTSVVREGIVVDIGVDGDVRCGFFGRRYGLPQAVLRDEPGDGGIPCRRLKPEKHSGIEGRWRRVRNISRAEKRFPAPGLGSGRVGFFLGFLLDRLCAHDPPARDTA